jgi:hypothetical protein
LNMEGRWSANIQAGFMNTNKRYDYMYYKMVS